MDLSNHSLTKWSSTVQLVTAMLRTGILGFGGGPSVIPLIQYEAVKRYKWIDEEEFSNMLALANALPGPIATKMGGYLGYRLKGWRGAVIGIIAHILPSSIAMIALMSLVHYLSQSAIVYGMIQGVTPVIAVMLGMMGYEFAQRAFKGLGIYAAIITIGLSFLLLQVAQIHPAIVIVIFLAYGSVHFKLFDRIRNWQARDKSHNREKGV